MNSSRVTDLPRYDTSRSYLWNYDHAPDSIDLVIPNVPGGWEFCGLPVDSPLGVPAGPLLNGRWCLYYASLGFDVLTYKSVRSVERACYPLPNLQPVECGSLNGGDVQVPAMETMQGSWAISFGMPSKSPNVWRADVERTKSKLARGKLLSVSVVGTIQDGWSIEELAEDYAACARWAVESGADCVETNFSCPNVTTCDGQLYQRPEDAAVVAAHVRQAIGPVPFIAKIGHLSSSDETAELLKQLAAHVDALSMTNCLTARVVSADGVALFNGQHRGIGGSASRQASLEQIRLAARLVDDLKMDIKLIGVGGVSTAEHFQQYLDAGAQGVHLATSAMLDPSVGIQIRSHSRAFSRALRNSD